MPRLATNPNEQARAIYKLKLVVMLKRAPIYATISERIPCPPV